MRVAVIDDGQPRDLDPPGMPHGLVCAKIIHIFCPGVEILHLTSPLWEALHSCLEQEAGVVLICSCGEDKTEEKVNLLMEEMSLAGYLLIAPGHRDQTLSYPASLPWILGVETLPCGMKSWTYTEGGARGIEIGYPSSLVPVKEAGLLGGIGPVECSYSAAAIAGIGAARKRADEELGPREIRNRLKEKAGEVIILEEVYNRPLLWPFYNSLVMDTAEEGDLIPKNLEHQGIVFTRRPEKKIRSLVREGDKVWYPCNKEIPRTPVEPPPCPLVSFQGERNVLKHLELAFLRHRYSILPLALSPYGPLNGRWHLAGPGFFNRLILFYPCDIIIQEEGEEDIPSWQKELTFLRVTQTDSGVRLSRFCRNEEMEIGYWGEALDCWAGLFGEVIQLVEEYPELPLIRGEL